MRKTKSELDQILIDKFYEIYPKSALPVWFDEYSCFFAFANKEKNAVQLTVYLKKVFELKERECLKEHNSLKIIVSTAENGKEKIGINYDYARYIIFTACLYKTLDVEIVTSLSMNELKALIKEDFVPNDATELVWRYSKNQ